MAITIDYSDRVTPQYVIQIPRNDMLLVQSSPEVRQLDIDDFRKTLNDLMDDSEGMSYQTNHVHTAPLTVSGVTLARVVEVLTPYAIEFEDGLYNVNIVGGNSNIADVVLKNQVGVNTANSAGLIQVVSGSGVTPGDIDEIVNRTTAEVWGALLSGFTVDGSAGEQLHLIRKLLANRAQVSVDENGAGTSTIFDDDKTTPILTFDHTDRDNRDPR